MKTPLELNAPGNDNFDDQNLPQRTGSSDDHGYGSEERDSEPIKLEREDRGGFFSRINTSFPLSGGETDVDLNFIFHKEPDEEFKRTPKGLY
jgi:hypothetical protein